MALSHQNFEQIMYYHLPGQCSISHHISSLPCGITTVELQGLGSPAHVVIPPAARNSTHKHCICMKLTKLIIFVIFTSDQTFSPSAKQNGIGGNSTIQTSYTLCWSKHTFTRMCERTDGTDLSRTPTPKINGRFPVMLINIIMCTV